jgi:hypothetical protein
LFDGGLSWAERRWHPRPALPLPSPFLPALPPAPGMDGYMFDLPPGLRRYTAA